MREILFRGKRIDNGKWVYGDLVQNTQDKHTLIIIAETKESVSYKEVDKDTIGQFTGLIDKNDTKIFEGDIVKGSGAIYWEVVYKDGGFYMVVDKDASVPMFALDVKEDEVIGNIYDNPELLGE